jgi:hypothetical protein
LPRLDQALALETWAVQQFPVEHKAR